MLFELLMMLHVCTAFPLKCPESAQWSIRATSLCPDPSKYFCLRNDIIKGYSENCTLYDFQQPGEKSVLRGGVDADVCSTARYQPWPMKFYTNVSTNCIFLKNTCNEEGQVVYGNGNRNTDTTCRCDYTRGYNFLVKPRNPCFCVPTEEDCSCYSKTCQDLDYVLSSDYECVQLKGVMPVTQCKQIVHRRISRVENQSSDEYERQTISNPGDYRTAVALFITSGLPVFIVLILPLAIVLIKTATRHCYTENKEQMVAATHCDPCAFSEKTAYAISFCTECDENLCYECLKYHNAQWQNNDHTVTNFISIYRCTICKNMDKDVEAVTFCLECKEKLCKDCVNKHKSMKSSRGHTFDNSYLCQQSLDKSDISTQQPIIQDHVDFVEQHNEDNTEAIIQNECTDINEPTRIDCGEIKTRPTTSLLQKCEKTGLPLKENLIARNETAKIRKFDLEEQIVAATDVSSHCNPCAFSGKTANAISFCTECEEYLCDECFEYHSAQWQSKGYTVTNLVSTYLCSICKNMDKDVEAYTFCLECKESLCEACATKHKSMKSSSGHNFESSYLCQHSLNQSNAQQPIIQHHVDFVEQNNEDTTEARIQNECTNIVEPTRVESAEIGTRPATSLLHKCEKISYNIYTLPLKENLIARNETAKIRKFDIGTEENNCTAKNILLVGATGSGKSTLIDTLANYIIGVKFEDEFRFKVTNLENSESERRGNEVSPKTEWVTCYTVHKNITDNVNFTVNLIDTPGFGESGSFENDKKLIEQICQLFVSSGEKGGVKALDAVCFLFKASDARKKIHQTYILESVLSLFGKDILNNICTFITFADEQKKPVLPVVDGITLPIDPYFVFNNSIIYSNTSKICPEKYASFTKIWEMEYRSCHSFFEYLNKMKTTSSRQTSKVLQMRMKLEKEIINLQQKIDDGMPKIYELEREEKTFSILAEGILANMHFEYEVEETRTEKIDLTGKNQYTLACLICNYVCHEDCSRAEGEDKANCSSMDTSGNCTRCPKRCKWNTHCRCSYIIKDTTKKVKKINEYMAKKYEEASQKILKQQQILEEIDQDIKIQQKGFLVILEYINKLVNKLGKIALHPELVSIQPYIDFIIESEEKQKMYGFEARLTVLYKHKNCTQYRQLLEKVINRVENTRKIWQRELPHLPKKNI